MWTILPFSKRKSLIKKHLTKRFMTNHFNFSIAFWIFPPLSHFADEKSHPFRLSRPSRDESYFSAHSAKKSPLLNPWPSGFLPLPFRRRKRGTGLVNPAPRFRPLHFSGKTVCTFAAFTVGFCGASRPAPPTSNKEQNAALTAQESVWIWSICPCRSLFYEVGRGFILPATKTHFSRPQSAFSAFFSACCPLII